LRRRLLRADTVTVALIGAESSPGRTRAWPVVRPRGPSVVGQVAGGTVTMAGSSVA